MNDERSPRLALPLLQLGQAQKDLTHNEALALLDMTVAAAVAGAGVDVPPATPAEGECWIVGAAPTAAWEGRAQALAGWTAGGWRFVAARAGLRAWDAATRTMHVHDGMRWEAGMVRASRVLVDGVQVLGARGAAIAQPAGGAVVDAEARAVLAEVLERLRVHGLIAS